MGRGLLWELLLLLLPGLLLLLLGLLPLALGLGSSSFSDLSWEPLKACRAEGPVLLLPGHLDSWKLLTPCP